MQYDLYNTLALPGTRVVCELDDTAPEGLECEAAGPVRGSIALTNTGSSITARGALAVSVILPCSRCLQPAMLPLEIAVCEDCALTEIDRPEAFAEEQIPLLNDGVVDLSELARQLIDLQTPPRILCRPDCAGLCPECGADLNQGECGCEPTVVDPRWAALQRLTDTPEANP